jgi:hypothetical protein
MSAQLVPLIIQPNQRFTIQLNVNGQALTLNLVLAYSAMAGYWQLAVSDVNGNLIVASVPLVTGLYPDANLLAQYEYLQIGEAYMLNTGDGGADYPGQYDLSQFSLLWSDNTEYPALAVGAVDVPGAGVYSSEPGQMALP